MFQMVNNSSFSSRPSAAPYTWQKRTVRINWEENSPLSNFITVLHNKKEIIMKNYEIMFSSKSFFCSFSLLVLSYISFFPSDVMIKKIKWRKKTFEQVVMAESDLCFLFNKLFWHLRIKFCTEILLVPFFYFCVLKSNIKKNLNFSFCFYFCKKMQNFIIILRYKRMCLSEKKKKKSCEQVQRFDPPEQLLAEFFPFLLHLTTTMNKEKIPKGRYLYLWNYIFNNISTKKISSFISAAAVSRCKLNRYFFLLPVCFFVPHFIWSWK